MITKERVLWMKKRALSLLLTVVLLMTTTVGISPQALKKYYDGIFYGDVDMNFELNTRDARLTLQAAVKKIEFSYIQEVFGDVDGNGVVNVSDARWILQKAVDKVFYFPIEDLAGQEEPIERDPEYTRNTILPDTKAAGKPFKDISEIPAGQVEVKNDTKTVGRFVFTTEKNPQLPFNIACDVTDNGITALLPAGVDLTSLVPEFTYYGKELKAGNTVLTSGVTSLDLSAPVTLTAVANDNSTKSITVTIETLNTGLPSVAVTTEGYEEIVDRENYINTKFYLGGGDAEICPYAMDDSMLVDATIKGRGNSSWLAPKKGYTVKLNEKARLLGMSNSRDWVLISNYEDKSLLRNTVAAYLAEISGQEYVMKCRAVDLWLNGQFWGNYLLMEKIEIEGDRVAITDYKDALAANNGEIPAPNQIGYLLEFDAHVVESMAGNNNFDIIKSLNPDELVQNGLYCNNDESFFTPSVITRSTRDGGYGKQDPTRCPICNEKLEEVHWEKRGEAYYNPKTNETFFRSKMGGKWITIKQPSNTYLRQEYINYIINTIGNAEEVLKTHNFNAVQNRFDVRSLVQWYIVEEFMNNTDSSMHSSVFVTLDVGGKIKLGPVWDFDRSAGNTDYWNTNNAIDFLYKSHWFEHLFQMPEARAILREEWLKFRNYLFFLEDTIQEMASVIYESQKLNFVKWDILDKKVGRNPNYTQKTYDEHLQFLINYLKVRFRQMDSRLVNLK